MSAAAIKIPLNIRLAFQLAARSLKHRKMIALATLLGVAIGVGVVNAVLIVDANTARGYEAEATTEQEIVGSAQAAKTAGQKKSGRKTSPSGSNGFAMAKSRNQSSPPSGAVPGASRRPIRPGRVRFLDHFTLFDYALRISLPATLYISALCVLTCVIASIYPAFIANRASSAESLHYE